MEIIKYLFQPVKKFCKGCFALTGLYAICVLCIFIFDSCKKSGTPYDDGDKAKAKFISAIKSNKAQIGSVGFVRAEMQNRDISIRLQKLSSLGKISIADDSPVNVIEPVYLGFPSSASPENISMINNITSVQQLADIQNATNAIIQYAPTPDNSNTQIDINIAALNNSLSPLIQESKQYLYSKGLSEQDIQDMLVEHNGKSEDLIVFVMALTDAEVQAPVISRNYLEPFIHTANAQLDANDYPMCAIVAIGADVLYSLAASGLKTWSKPLIKKAFGTVAKRFLGPVGVAIAVVSFGVCLAERND